ncbi:hypothetical protein KY284_026389 [Solanum tuberosum]|nr:hypothetical protein KY284_026389 [Solanum tuberosum]
MGKKRGFPNWVPNGLTCSAGIFEKSSWVLGENSRSNKVLLEMIRLGHLKQYLTSRSFSRITRKKFLNKGFLGGCLPRTIQK